MRTVCQHMTLHSLIPAHPSLLTHDPFVHCDDSRRSCGSSELPSPTSHGSRGLNAAGRAACHRDVDPSELRPQLYNHSQSRFQVLVRGVQRCGGAESTHTRLTGCVEYSREHTSRSVMRSNATLSSKHLLVVPLRQLQLDLGEEVV